MSVNYGFNKMCKDIARNAIEILRVEIDMQKINS